MGRQIEGFEEVAILVDAGVFGGEQLVAVENGIRAGKETERLRFTAEKAASSREADFCFWQNEAGGRDEANEFKNIHRRGVLEGRSGHGHEAIDRNALGRGVKGAKNLQHLQSVDFCFSHAEDATAANAHSRSLHGANRIKSVLKCVRADDFCVVLG